MFTYVTLQALGMARTAEVKRDARIGEAEAKRDAQIKEAMAEEERMASRLNSQSHEILHLAILQLSRYSHSDGPLTDLNSKIILDLGYIM